MRARDTHWPGCYAFLLALLTLGGCTSPDKVALKEYAPKSADADIEAVSLSASSNDTFDPTRVGTEFPDTTQQVAVWYRWGKADSGKKVGIRWSKDGEVVLEQADTLAKVSGASAYVLKMAAGSKLPVGGYQVELLENGVAVTKIPFKVGSGGTESGGPVATETGQTGQASEAGVGGSADSAAVPAATAATTDSASESKAAEPLPAEAPAVEAQPSGAPAGTAVGGGPAQ